MSIFIFIVRVPVASFKKLIREQRQLEVFDQRLTKLTSTSIGFDELCREQAKVLGDKLGTCFGSA